MTQYTHKQPALPAPPPAPKRAGFRKKLVILLLAAALGSAFHKASVWFRSPNHDAASGSGNVYSNLTAHGSLFEVFQKYRPHRNEATSADEVGDKRLSMKKISKNNKQNQEYAALMRAAFAGDVALLPSGNGKFETINRLSAEGRSPLHIAASSGAIELAKELLKRGANVNLANNSEQTPLHFAAWNNQPSIIPLLLENMAKINAADKSGNTPLMFASARDNREIVALLLSRGANQNIRNKAGQSAFSIAKTKGFEDITTLLEQPKPPRKTIRTQKAEEYEE